MRGQTSLDRLWKTKGQRENSMKGRISRISRSGPANTSYLNNFIDKDKTVKIEEVDRLSIFLIV